MIKNLSIEGAGVCGIAYSGVILELDKRGIMKGIEKVAGVSAGAIVAGLVSLRYNSKEIFDIMVATDFKTFEDGNIFDKSKVFKKYGLHPGDTFLDWIKEKIKRKGLPENATFADFKKHGCLDLHVFATDLNEQNLRQFSVLQTPNVSVAEAIRASMSIPLLFDAFQFTNGIPNNHIYVDGGCVFNYPLSAFDTEIENTETLGLFIGDIYGTTKASNLNYGQFPRYMRALIETILNSQTINIAKDKEDLARTVVIGNCGISATNFDLSVNDKMKLFEAGRDAVIKYFANS